LQDAKFKGYINMAGYKVIADENANPGYYGFRIIHDKEAPHFFSLQEQGLVREWMKALMKATISRDYSSEFAVYLSYLFRLKRGTRTEKLTFRSLRVSVSFSSRRLVVQHPYDDAQGSSSNEPSSSTSFSFGTGCYAGC